MLSASLSYGQQMNEKNPSIKAVPWSVEFQLSSNVTSPSLLNSEPSIKDTRIGESLVKNGNRTEFGNQVLVASHQVCSNRILVQEILEQENHCTKVETVHDSIHCFGMRSSRIIPDWTYQIW